MTDMHEMSIIENIMTAVRLENSPTSASPVAMLWKW
jgi:hypothetical protein